MKNIVAMDWETHRIAAGQLLPPGVCCSFATDDGSDTQLLSTVQPELREFLEWLYSDPHIYLVTHNGGFDHGVTMATYPELIPLVFAKLIDQGMATDTLWREKLINLSTTGRLQRVPLPDGTSKDIRYRLSDLEFAYLGIDRSEEKDDLEDSWRANYGALDGWLPSEYPEDARRYAMEDAENTLRVYQAQEDRLRELPYASVVTQEFQLAKSHALQLMSAWGMEVNQERTDALEAEVVRVTEENKDLLEQHGILRTATVGEPYKKCFEEAKALLPEQWHPGLDWSPYAEALSEQGIKFKKPKSESGSVDTFMLQRYARDLYQRLGEIPTLTGSLIRDHDGSTHDRISLEAEIKDRLALVDPVMEQFRNREELGKLRTQIIPVLRSGPVVYPSYDAIKETGRTSSYDGGHPGKKRGEPRQYPSVNIQQIPGEISDLDPRACFQPRNGTVFFDIDFTGLELACIGHVTHTLYQQGVLGVDSLHRQLYNEGVDLHGYLGAQLALNSPSSSHAMAASFQDACRTEGILDHPRAVYDAFRLLKIHDDADVRDFFAHFRKFAKPVGLGFPGGLGPPTLVEFARKTYGVILTEEQARMFRDFWHATYPEMAAFFQYVEASIDEFNYDKDGGRLHWYTSPMGMVRRGASYCADANGECMQTPGAEAATSAAILVARACYDRSQDSIVYGCRPIAFVHDQIIGEVGHDPSLWAAQCEELARLMRVGAELVLDSMHMRTDEALLTRVWSKKAKPVRGADGQLIPWEPTVA